MTPKHHALALALLLDKSKTASLTGPLYASLKNNLFSIPQFQHMISLGNYAKDTLEINMHKKLQLCLNDPLPWNV